MGDQHVSVVKIGQQILGAAAERANRAPFQPGGKPFRQRKSQIGAALVHTDETRSFQNGLQSPAHGFHFGQFRHVCLPGKVRVAFVGRPAYNAARFAADSRQVGR